MFLASLLFQILNVAAVLIVSIIRFHVLFDKAGIFLMLYHILIYSLWLYSMSLLLSTIASYTGSEAAYMILIGIQTFMIAMLSLNNTDWRGTLLRSNLASRLVLGWYSSTVRLLPYQMRATYRNFFISCWRVSSFLLKPCFSINYCLIPVYHVRILEELKTHQKEQYSFFWPKILFVESIFHLWS